MTNSDWNDTDDERRPGSPDGPAEQSRAGDDVGPGDGDISADGDVSADRTPHDDTVTDPTPADDTATGPIPVVTDVEPAPSQDWGWQTRPSGALSRPGGPLAGAGADHDAASASGIYSGTAAGGGTGPDLSAPGSTPAGQTARPGWGNPWSAGYPGPVTAVMPGWSTASARTSSSPLYGFDPATGQPRPGEPKTADRALAAERTDGKPAARGRNGRWFAAALAVVVLALIAGFGGGLLGSSLMDRGTASTADTSLTQHPATQQAAASVPAPAGSVQAVAEKVLPSVVSVVAVSSSGEDEGSGVILTSSGLILTNNHVISGASRLTVQFNDGTTGTATVVGTDPTDDLAVIKVPGVSGLVPATLGTSADLAVGQQVVAVGSPLGLSATVTTGIVSALNRPVRTGSADQQGPSTKDTVLNAIQTDAAINPGNSGGPLLDMAGNVIGINSAIATLSAGAGGQSGSIGVGFAIPIDQAHRVAQEIINTGKASHAVLGAIVRDAVDKSSGVTTGAQIVSVTDGSGAAKAGLRADDVVTKVGDTPVESADALVATIRSSDPGGKIQLTYQRDGASSTVTVTLGSATN